MTAPLLARGLHRFAADLPAVTDWVTLGEGDTPLLALPTLARQLGLRSLSAKMEVLNPTGSYKDRVAAMSMSLARDRGHRGWIATSSGNAGLAMAAYGARAGLAGFLCLVSTAPPDKRLPLLPYGAHLLAVDGVGDSGTAADAGEMFDQVRTAAARHDLYLGITAHAFNPDGMRGIDTIGYELAEQAPDTTTVYVPTGGGGLLTALARGLRRRGMTSRLICCQPSGCAPLVQFLDGKLPLPRVDDCHTSISALQLPRPPDGQAAADAVLASHGWGTAAADATILSAQQLLAATEGVFVEPAAATTLAALQHDLTTGRLAHDDRPVLILTGAGWKDHARLTAHADQIPTVQPSSIGCCVDMWVSDLPSQTDQRE